MAVALLLFTAGIARTAGEILAMASNWGLSVALVPEESKGEYQGPGPTATQGAQKLGPR